MAKIKFKSAKKKTTKRAKKATKKSRSKSVLRKRTVKGKDGGGGHKRK